MAERPYEFLEEYTADIGFIAYGATLEELLINSAIALMEIQTNIKDVKPEKCTEVDISAHDLLSLFRDWLEELLYLRDAENLFLSKFEIISLQYNSSSENRWTLKARVCGENINPKKHVAKVEVKAVSYYDMEICQKDFKYTAKVLVDI